MSNIGRAVMRPTRKIKKNKPFVVKTLVKHPQYNGIFKDDDGKPIPKDYIAKFEVFYGAEMVFSIDSTSALSENPKMDFWMTVDRSDELKVVWTDDKGNQIEKKKSLKL